MQPDIMDPQESPHKERLWTPWRMRYIGGEIREEGCIFCNRLAADNDVESLILHRSQHAFVIMNLYPYNTGHVMIVPNAHQADIEELDETTLIDMATLLPKVTTALRSVFGCQGFNIGLNLGSIAGAGVAAHLHQHVVPRWEGDANFMPILGGTMVIPELIPASYAKIRAEMARGWNASATFEAVIVSGNDPSRAWLKNGEIPRVHPRDTVPVWRAIMSSIDLPSAEIVGWAGSTETRDSKTLPGLVIRPSEPPAGEGWHDIEVRPGNDDFDALPEPVRESLLRAIGNLARWIAVPE